MIICTDKLNFNLLSGKIDLEFCLYGFAVFVLNSIKCDTYMSRKNLLEEVKEIIRLRHYSIHTERTYCDWIVRYIRYHKMHKREDLQDGERKIEEFLTYLAVEKDVAPATQNQAMNALVFLYKIEDATTRRDKCYKGD